MPLDHLARGNAPPLTAWPASAVGSSLSTDRIRSTLDFQKELRFLGIESSPAFVRAPERNGCAERFIRTLKGNLLWVRPFDTVEDLRAALLEFPGTYNTTWLIERHGFRPPADVRNKRLQSGVSASAGGTGSSTTTVF